jgi:hypothetical protein
VSVAKGIVGVGGTTAAVASEAASGVTGTVSIAVGGTVAAGESRTHLAVGAAAPAAGPHATSVTASAHESSAPTIPVDDLAIPHQSRI